MPSYSNMRKSSTATVNAPDSHLPLSAAAAVASSSTQPRRTASGRAVRTNTTRPTNYYARSFGPINPPPDADAAMNETASGQPVGFFPGLQFFSDAITALPKEVVRQFTLMKEVEGKIHGPQERLNELLDDLLAQAVSTRKQNAGASDFTGGKGLMSFTANNSANGSRVPSLVNGVAGRHSAQGSLTGSVNGDEMVAETHEEEVRRALCHELRMQTHSLLPNLDEKNVVLSEANRILAQQRTRIDSVWPTVLSEISDEAKYGSMTHWAYSDNREKRKQATGAAAANRRDVAAANSLAAAATMVRESEIAEARVKAGREAVREKTRGKRMEAPGDSDFDDKPKKTQKIGKGKAATSAAGLGISTNGEPAPKRKKMAERVVPMERTVSATGRGAKARETPRSTPAVEPTTKKVTKAKPGPAPKRRLPNSAQASPMLASSPLATTFAATPTDPSIARPQHSRMRTNSVATNLRHEKLQDEEAASRPASAAGKSDKTNGKRKAREAVEEPGDNAEGDEQLDKRLQAAVDKLKNEDTDMPDTAGPEPRPVVSRSGSSHKNSGRTSKIGTPKQDSFSTSGGDNARARSRRSKRNGEGRDSTSSEPAAATGKHHKRAPSNSHLVKQLAPFNRSPDLDRHRSRDDMDEDLESLEGGRGNEAEADADPEVIEEDQLDEEETGETSKRASSGRRPPSQRNLSANTNVVSSPAPISRESTPAASSPPPPPPPATTVPLTTSTRSRAQSSHVPDDDNDEDDQGPEDPADAILPEEDDESEHDPDDPNEQKYCYCNRGSYGEMVACDNNNCPMEWFHLGCTELREAPGRNEEWYCRECRPRFGPKARGRGRKV